MRIFLFIPCYNCEAQIPRVIARLAAENIVNSFERIAVVDNRSSDRTVAEAKAAIMKLTAVDRQRFRIYVNSENFGLGGSFRSFFMRSKKEGFTHFAVLHGDNQADGRDLKIVLSQLELEPSVAAILGSRFSRKSIDPNRQYLSGYSWFRCGANLTLNFLLTAFSGRLISELGSGLNMYRTDAFDESFIARLPSHIAFDLFLLLQLLSSKKKFVFIPISWRKRDEKTTINEFAVGWLLLREIIKWRVSGLKLSVLPESISCSEEIVL